MGVGEIRSLFPLMDSLERLDQLAKDVAMPVQATLTLDMTIGEATRILREKNEVKEGVFYFYVVDSSNQLRGVVSSRELLLHNSKLRIRDILKRKLITISGHQSMSAALKMMEKHRLLAVPVVDGQGHFLGIIDVHHCLEQQLDVDDTRHRIEVFQLLGLELDKGKRTSVWKNYSLRMPWIFCNMLGGFACAVISHFYALTLSKVLILAMFIPLVLSLSESISMQSMTESIQESTKHIRSWRIKAKYVFKEARLYLLLALTSGFFVGGISLFWGSGIFSGMTIGLAIMLSILITATIGGSIPLILHSLRLDPKVASGPVVLMFADVITTAIYLSLATWWLL